MALPLVLPRTVMQHPIPKLESTTPAASTAAPTCTHTFDTWRNFAVTYAAQRNVSGKYGVDFRFAPEPSGGERRTLRLLDTAAKCLGPRILKRSAVQFDFIENSNARAQNTHPCAQPSTHVYPSTSTSQPHATISTSSSATPRASPEQERPQARLSFNQHQQDPLHDVFFNFDLASPSEASAPPDTDGEQDHDTEGTDTESERELRLSDLEGPVALRRRTTHGRGRVARRPRAESISTTSTSSGPGASPVSPTAMRSVGSARAPYPSVSASASALRPTYARRSFVLSPAPIQAFKQTQSQSQPVPGMSTHFPTSVSESGASPSSTGIGSVGLSSAARARMRGRGIGASKSEPDPDITPTNTAGTSSAGPAGGGMQLGGSYSIGPYGYRYPIHPPYPPPVLDVSASQMQTQAQEYGPPTGLDTVKEETPTSIVNWQTQASAVGMGSSMEIDMDMGGWGKVSEPLPGMDLGFGMNYASSYMSQSQTHTPSQTQGNATYRNQTYNHQSPYSPQPAAVQPGITGTFGAQAQLPYYTSPTLPSMGEAQASMSMGLTANASLNMSSSRWKATTTSSTTSTGGADSGTPGHRPGRGHVHSTLPASAWSSTSRRN